MSSLRDPDPGVAGPPSYIIEQPAPALRRIAVIVVSAVNPIAAVRMIRIRRRDPLPRQIRVAAPAGDPKGGMRRVFEPDQSRIRDGGGPRPSGLCAAKAAPLEATLGVSFWK